MTQATRGAIKERPWLMYSLWGDMLYIMSDRQLCPPPPNHEILIGTNDRIEREAIMRIKYTELGREKLARINAQMQVLQLQANQLTQERNELYNSILQRENIASDK